MTSMPDVVQAVAALQRQAEETANAEKEAARQKQKREIDAFAATGIPHMWEQLVTYCEEHGIELPHWRDKPQKVPLREYRQTIVHGNILGLYGPCRPAQWWTAEDEDGVMRYHRVDPIDGHACFLDPNKQRQHFIAVMAKLLPNLTAITTPTSA